MSGPYVMVAWKLASGVAALALAGCGSEPDRSVGPEPDPGGGTNGVALAFSDSALQSAVTEAAGETGGAAGLVTLTAKERGITDLDGIEQLTHLEVLDLYGNEIRDLSPLAGLRRLRYLDLGSNRVEDVSPLASLRSLRVLLLADNRVTEVSALAGLDSLQSVDLNGNPLGEAAQTQVAALRERGVAVDFAAPESGDAGGGVILGELPIVFASSRRTGSRFLHDVEVHSLDPETGEVVNLSEDLARAPFSDGSMPGSLDRGVRRGEEPAQSPDGSRIAFASGRDGNREIYVMDADGGGPENVTRHEAWDVSPAWSPDGKRIAFVSDRNGDVEVWPGTHLNTEVFVMNADGSGVEQVTYDALSRSAQGPAWSPDGSSIAFSRSETTGIFILDLSSREVRRVSEDRWAWVAFVVSRRPLDRPHRPRRHPVGDGRRRRPGPAADLRRGVLGRRTDLVSGRYADRLLQGGERGQRHELRPLRHPGRGRRRRADHRPSEPGHGTVLGTFLRRQAMVRIHRRLIPAALVLAGCGSDPTPPVGPGPGGPDGVALVFADSALQAAVEAAAAESGGAAGLVTLTAKERGIANLDGIEQLTRLEALDLYGNEIRDLTPLSGLTRLRYLDLGSNRVEEVSPLESLKGLQVLLLADNEVTEVSALADVDSLQSLDLTGNPLSEAAQVQVAAFRERGVTVEFTAPEPEDTVQVVPPDGGLLATRLLFTSNRRLESGYLRDLEVHSLDLETGEVVNLSSALTGLPKSDGTFPDSLEALYFTRRGEQPARSPDGTKVAFSSIRDRNLEIYVMDADGGNPVNLTRDDAFDSAPAWSPDGQRIAFERNSSGGGGPQIYVMNADGSGVERLTEEPLASWGQSPAWSPDGSSIACLCGRDGEDGIFIMDLDGGGMRFVSPEGQFGGQPSWSPDGAWIAYVVVDLDMVDVSHLWVMAADGSGARQLTFAKAWDETPTWSPDGTRIAFARLVDVETRYDIYIVPVEGGAEERVTDDPHDDLHPNWTPF